MNKFMKALSYILAFSLGAFIMTGYIYYRLGGKASTGVSKLDQLETIIDERFIEDVDMTALEDAAADAMVTATGDRWSYYIPASQYASYVEQMQNAYVGIGVTIQPSEEPAGLEVVQVTAGGPAEAAGIQVFDVIVEAEGQNCSEIGMEETRNIIRGEAGTQVQLTINRQGETLEFTVTREKIDVPVATYEVLDSGYGLITISNFDSKCAHETIAAIEELMEQNVKGIVFDVRFNPGGYKHELVEVLDYILPEGPLFRSETYDGKTETDTSDAGHIEIPMAVLVNGDSYSAAEFFAAALQEYDYAIVVGEKTCGKGYFQNTITLSDGSAVALSVGKYFTPNGVSLAGVGITPDVTVEVDEDTYAAIYGRALEPSEDPQLQAAISALNSADLP
ncbi:MAG: S41 family peptidase [Candidatus Faecousia sp.]|nr:S41 family peptidase [Bacillota bacterium]MDY4220489.1 S41 family peptidase [Candidatus Faecousia sp.]